MKGLSRIMAALVPLLLLLFSFQGCAVHEFPDVAGKYPVVLNLHFDTAMPDYKEVNYSSKGTKTAEDYDIRYVVKVYRHEMGEEFTREALETLTFTEDDFKAEGSSVLLLLEKGYYRFRVWADYVDEGTAEDKFYNTADFAEVKYPDKDRYVGDTDFKDAFRGVQTAALEDDAVLPLEVDVAMERPLAKYVFISTDYRQFVANMLLMQAQRAQSSAAGRMAGAGTDTAAASGMEADTEAGAAGTETGSGAGEYDGGQTKTIDPSDYTVVLRYAGYLPYSFNLYNDKPADAWTGVYFTAAIVPLDDGSAQIGFDYVIVNGVESSVSVAVEVYDNVDKSLIASFDPVTVPVTRSKLTTVKGEFLTTQASGGVGIQPDFNGEWNYKVN